mgnify:CR=1 FL=1
MNIFTICDTREEADKLRTAWGNSYFLIMREDIEALLAGKILGGDVGGEYGLFIKMEDDDNDQ